MSTERKIPTSVSDSLLHMKDTDGTEKTVLPLTRYKNVMNAPKVISNPFSSEGAPYALYVTDTEELDVVDIRKLINGLL